MGGIPDLMFVIDTNKEAIAIQEARKLNIPVIAILGHQLEPGRHHLSDPGQRRRRARHPALLRPDGRLGAGRPGRRPGGLGRRPGRLGSPMEPTLARKLTPGTAALKSPPCRNRKPRPWKPR
jgi:small subunit ribosomal protein S2